jgi:hypothetical protein
VSGGNITTPPDIHKPNVLALMASWAKRDQPDQPLNVTSIIVVPDFVALDRVLIPLAIADFAAVVGCFECTLLQYFP